MSDMVNKSRLHERLQINRNKKIPKKLLEYILRAGNNSTLWNPTFEGIEVINTDQELLRLARDELFTRPPKKSYRKKQIKL